MRRGGVAVLATVAALAAGAAPANAEPIEVGHIPQCVELVPASLAPPSSDAVALDVLVLLDGVSLSRGQEVFGLVAQSYGPLGIPVQATYQGVSFSGTDAQLLINQAKAAVGGSAPAGVDVVYVLTSKDIEAGLTGDAVAGMADCIGGVAFPDRAFAVGEVLEPDSEQVGDITIVGKLTAKVAAHELGHLLGGHHHYANCVEGLLSELGAEVSPCTLMINDVGLSSFNFSALNGLVVRGHAESYAD